MNGREWSGTYGSLAAWVGELALTLVEMGVVSGDRVALLMRHDSPQIAAVLAVLRVGAVVVVLHPSDTPNRLIHLVEDVEPSLLICDSSNAELSQELCSMGLSRLEMAARPVGSPRHCSDLMSASVLAPVSPDQLAFLIYKKVSLHKN